MPRGDLTGEEWDIVEGLLPSERGRKARAPHYDQRLLNGMLHVLRAGCSSRDMHELFSN